VKYGVVILGGAADEPLDELGGRTALEAAETPTLDAIARAGRVGAAVTTPPERAPSSEIALTALLGFDPLEVGVARGPIEALGMGVDLAPDEAACRCSLVTVGVDPDADEGVLLNHATPGLTTPEARALFEAVEQAWRMEAPEDSLSIRLVTGAGHRAVLIDSSGRALGGVETWAPHEVIRRPWDRVAPEGEHGEWLRRLMAISFDALRDHEVNRARRENGLQPATMLWLWGLGRAPRKRTFEEAYGLRAAMVTGRAVGAGVAKALGIDRIPAPGLTPGDDTDYAAMGEAASAALDRYDVVIVDASAPDAAAHRADPIGKVRALEAIDRDVLTALRDRLASFGDAEASPVDDPSLGWRLLVTVDHATSAKTGEHLDRPAPFALAGAWVRSVVERTCTEAEADESDLVVDPGFELMEYALYSALKSARRVRRQRPRAGAEAPGKGESA
jgi:2,3-bisphosphoglycerate-independent phosphoglycerate mutase